MRKLVASCLLFFIGCGCATSDRGKLLEGMLVGALTGTALGYTRSDYKEQNALMYAGIGSGVGALVTTFRNDSDQKRETLLKEKEELQAKIDLIERPILKDQGGSLFQSQIPKDLSKLIQPGSWKRYKVDYWVQDPGNTNTWFRQTEMLEVIPPSTN